MDEQSCGIGTDDGRRFKRKKTLFPPVLRLLIHAQDIFTGVLTMQHSRFVYTLYGVNIDKEQCQGIEGISSLALKLALK